MSQLDLSKQTLQKSYSRLIDFAKNYGFVQNCENVFIVEELSIRRFFDSTQLDEFPKSALNKFEDYEKYFDEFLLKQGHSWINLSLLGVLEEKLILIVELPNYTNDSKFTSVNISLSNSKNSNWDISSFYRIVD